MIFSKKLAGAACVLLVAACGGATSGDTGAGQLPSGSPSSPSPPQKGAPPANPGVVVAASASCEGAAALTLGSGEGIPSAIEVDDARVYWLTHAGAQADGGVKLRAADKCGGAAITIATGPYFAEGLAQDDTTLFFSTSIGSGQGAILSVPKAGGAAVTLKQGAFRPAGIAVDGSSIYWVDAYESAVYALPKAGGAPKLLATNLSPGGLTSPDRVVVAGTDVYAAGQAGVAKIPVGGGAASVIFAQPVDDLRVAGGALVIASRAGLFSLSLTDGSTKRLADGGNSACASAQDVAFVTGGIVELHRVPFLGGADDILASGAKGPSVVACDASAAYWAGSGQITRTALR